MSPLFITFSVLSKHLEQLRSSKLLFRTTPRIIKLGTKSPSGRKLSMQWIWSYPVSKKVLLLKLAVSKKQEEPSKTIFVAFASCMAKISLKTTLFQVNATKSVCSKAVCTDFWARNNKGRLKIDIYLNHTFRLPFQTRASFT